MSKEREVDKITIHYDDGEEKIVEKGFFCNMKEENGQMVLEFIMCHVGGDRTRSHRARMCGAWIQTRHVWRRKERGGLLN